MSITLKWGRMFPTGNILKIPSGGLIILENSLEIMRKMMTGKEQAIALIALAEKTFEEDYYVTRKTTNVRRNPFRFIYDLFRNEKKRWIL